MRAYAIGDIHGHLDKLETAHDLIAADRAEAGWADAPVVHIGDVCDRGPDTKGVIEFLVQGQARGENWVTLKGNHDRLMEWFLEDEPRNDQYLIQGYSWLHPRIGGPETLASYGVEFHDRERLFRIHNAARKAIPDSHAAFLKSLPLSFELGELFFCHAGIRPGVALSDQAEMDLLWIREEFHESDADHGALIVHGHTPAREVEHHGNRLNIDTGAAYGKALSTVAIEGRDVWLLTPEGRVKVNAP